MKVNSLPRAGRVYTRVATTIPEVRQRLASARAQGKKIGLVPTMGCFHEGHLSLMRSARSQCGLVAVSIYVNPTQFGAGEDLEAYPRDLQRDLELAFAESVDLVFAPDNDEMYGNGVCTSVEPGPAAEGLCGRARPGHFRGVATVVAKLLNIFQPDYAYFGQKDAQQTAVIAQMVRDLDFGTHLRVMPTVREKDGLAMSSRNAYLSPGERERAAVLYRALSDARRTAASGERDAAAISALISHTIKSVPGVELEYAEVVHADTMRRLAAVTPRALAAVAATAGRARLIDNIFLLGGPEK